MSAKRKYVVELFFGDYECPKIILIGVLDYKKGFDRALEELRRLAAGGKCKQFLEVRVIFSGIDEGGLPTGRSHNQFIAGRLDTYNLLCKCGVPENLHNWDYESPEDLDDPNSHQFDDSHEATKNAVEFVELAIREAAKAAAEFLEGEIAALDYPIAVDSDN